MSTRSLKELATMMELSNETENEALTIALEELKHRGVNTENIPLLKDIGSIERDLHKVHK